jgi:hypothetical protein
VREHVEAFPVELDAVYLPLEPDFYAVGLELSGSGGLDATQRAMRFLEWAADRQLDAARREASIERFYVELAHAGLLYRAADAICAFLTDLAAGGNRDTAELESRRVIYEERRVTIVGSFFHAASFHWDVNPTWPPSIGAWIDALATLPPTTARAIVHDYALKLIIPGYMRDLVLGSVWRLTGDTQNALQALQRAHEQLTANHQLSPPLPWEPNLLLALSDELARAHQSLGT